MFNMTKVTLSVRGTTSGGSDIISQLSGLSSVVSDDISKERFVWGKSWDSQEYMVKLATDVEASLKDKDYTATLKEVYTALINRVRKEYPNRKVFSIETTVECLTK